MNIQTSARMGTAYVFCALVAATPASAIKTVYLKEYPQVKQALRKFDEKHKQEVSSSYNVKLTERLNEVFSANAPRKLKDAWLAHFLEMAGMKHRDINILGGWYFPYGLMLEGRGTKAKGSDDDLPLHEMQLRRNSDAANYWFVGLRTVEEHGTSKGQKSYPLGTLFPELDGLWLIGEWDGPDIWGEGSRPQYHVMNRSGTKLANVPSELIRPTYLNQEAVRHTISEKSLLSVKELLAEKGIVGDR